MAEGEQGAELNSWLLGQFKDLRLKLKERGLLVEFLRALRALGSPTGELSLYEVIDRSTPEQWRAAVEQITARDMAQLGFPAEVEHER